MRTSSPETRRLLALGLLAGLVLAGASTAASASAHDNVVSSSPYNGQVVTKAVDTVSVTFSDALLVLGASSAGASSAGANGAAGASGVSGSNSDAQGFAIVVTDADGWHHESGCVSVDGTSASTDVALGEAGEYDVTWKVVSADGHPISGNYSFTWQPSAVTMAAPAFEAAPDCGGAWSGNPGNSAGGSAGQTAALPEGSQTDLSGEATVEPEPTMTILSAVPAVENDDSGLAVPLGIVAAIAGLAGLSAVLFYVIRRAKGDRASKP